MDSEQRAAQAWEAMNAGGYDPDDDRAAVSDLLADLGHLCRQRGMDFRQLVKMAKMHLEAEAGPEATEGDKCPHCGADADDIDWDSYYVDDCGGRMTEEPGVSRDGQCRECGGQCMVTFSLLEGAIEAVE